MRNFKNQLANLGRSFYTVPKLLKNIYISKQALPDYESTTANNIKTTREERKQEWNKDWEEKLKWNGKKK